MIDPEKEHAEVQKYVKLIEDNGKKGLDFAATLIQMALKEESTNCYYLAKSFVDIMEKRK